MSVTRFRKDGKTMSTESGVGSAGSQCPSALPVCKPGISTTESTMSNIQEAIALLRASGYRITKARPVKAERPALNAIGKPYSPQFDPNYRMKHKPTTAHLFKPYGRWMKFVTDRPVTL